jgi:hypothetical protein
VFFEQVNRSLLFELCCDVGDGPAEERAAEARDEEGNEERSLCLLVLKS